MKNKKLKVFISSQPELLPQQRVFLDRIVLMVNSLGHEALCMSEVAKALGRRYSAENMLKYRFELMSKSDFIITNTSIGEIEVGIDVGFCFAKDIPILIISQKNKKIPQAFSWMAKSVLYYMSISDIRYFLRDNINFKERTV